MVMKKFGRRLVHIAALLLAGTLALPSGALGGSAPPKLEAFSPDRNTVVINLVMPEGSLAVERAEALYGEPGRGFVRLELPGCAHTSQVGRPQLPLVSAVISAPLGALIELEVDPGPFSEQTVEGRVMPAMPPAPKVPGIIPRFDVDRKAYAADSFHPAPLGEIYDASARGGLVRGRRLVSVILYPVKYNPARGIIREHKRMTATVRFRHPDWEATARSAGESLPRPWDEFIRRLCLVPPHDSGPRLLEAGHYDIFHGSGFQAAAKRLADWKSRLGYKVRLSDAGGWTAQALRDTIRLRQPLASYVLLISDPNAGGLNSIPASGPAQTTGLPTDLYYAVADTGYFPDVFLGRLSVRTAVDAEIAVDKIIRYQQADFGTSGTDWIRKALFIAGYDGSFQWVGRATNRYCYNILKREGYSEVDTLVIPSSGTDAGIKSRINSGRAWAVYSAHGSQDSWAISGSDAFTVSEVPELANADMQPMVSGHCCNSGYYFWGSGDCFGEAWPKLAGRGGIAYYGCFPYSYWNEDDWLQRRYFDAIYDSLPGSPGLRMPEPGRFTQYGLHWIELNTASTYKRYYFEGYHLLGDPAMQLWTSPPRSLAADHPEAVPPGADSMSIVVWDAASGQPVPGALACVWSKAVPDMHRAAFTDLNGAVSLPLEPGILGDTLLVTASGHNFRPYLSQALVKTKLAGSLSPRTILVNVPTEVSLSVTKPDSGDAPVCSLEIFASYNGSPGQMVAVTGPDGLARFTLAADRGGYVALAGLSDHDIFRDTVRVLAPKRPALGKAYPNPAGRLVNVAFELPDAVRAEISLYNVAGQKVRTLLSGTLPAGYHTLVWDGADGRGKRCPAGVYFLALKAEGRGRVPPMRIVLVR